MLWVDLPMRESLGSGFSALSVDVTLWKVLVHRVGKVQRRCENCHEPIAATVSFSLLRWPKDHAKLVAEAFPPKHQSYISTIIIQTDTELHCLSLVHSSCALLYSFRDSWTTSQG